MEMEFDDWCQIHTLLSVIDEKGRYTNLFSTFVNLFVGVQLQRESLRVRRILGGRFGRL
jgi:hypothetical protein